MLPGLMQDRPLAIIDILRFAATAHGTREIVSKNVDEPIWRSDYAGTMRRVAQAAHMLAGLGLKAGDRISTLSWNTHRHFELFYAAPGMGLVVHTANPRLPDDHLIYTINHAGSRVLLLDRNMVPIYERIRDELSTVEKVILLTDSERTLDGYEGYEDLIAGQPESYKWPVFDENTAAFLCYTSGTTGDPKGVLYTHRSVVLHGFAAGLSGALGFSAFDVVMPCQSLYHATAWGLPFAGPINGVKFVFPCDKFDGASLQKLIEDEGVTFSGGVPTIWTMYLDHLERTGGSPGTLQRVIIGGSAVPRDMAVAFDKLGVTVQQIWGMTETCPLGVVATSTPALAERGRDAELEQIWTRQGRMMFGIEMKIVDEEGNELPHDGEASGALMVRGPWVLERYYRTDKSACDADGWFDTGDISTIDELGFMRITDRKKDVIKSGGEWISSIDLENTAAGCPGVKVAAVAGVYHPKWEERPIMLIEAHDGVELSEDSVRAYLEARIAKWWMPDRIFFEPVPMTATGKIDKKVIRDRHGNALNDLETS
ncbi:long-chain fatty acid--CoA ligase [Tsuneonella sp. CC-YZS046]|uniref:long-chain fatty acid--CoA ligase n=1 Tax=Tsuneonella sp. CC-YZS046 TaxID=3042152 RepID=UPI002D79E65F|nr:long-chain fatty acid--CoA ligase [Tsuneonella sp. CC-YZS046]WRO67257.1 long-chain fatty acid--CoA ligase [Tsuneonella sp. CC-YZS046]